MCSMRVFIDLGSIEENPRAGETETIITRDPECTFRYVGDQSFKDNYSKDLTVTSIRYFGRNGDYKLFDVEGVFTDLKQAQEFKDKEIKGLTIHIGSNNEVISHLPLPKYYYNFNHINIKCSNCGHTQMTDVVYCDVCEEELDFELENITEALKRKNERM